ncbi:MAG: hypothetical protein ACLRVT_07195, partial [Oscillospiraceae bacterium]
TIKKKAKLSYPWFNVLSAIQSSALEHGVRLLYHKKESEAFIPVVQCSLSHPKLCFGAWREVIIP